MASSPRNGCCSEDPAKRQAILDQAIRAFAELGFRGTDVQVIADRAGVGKGTVYRYLRSKEDLFWAASFEVCLRLERAVLLAMEGIEGACAKLRASAVAYSHFYEENPHYLELAVQERAEFRGAGPESHREHHLQMVAKFCDVIEQGIAAGEIRAVDSKQTTLSLACLLYGTTVLGTRLESIGAVQLAEHAIDMFLDGIIAKPVEEKSFRVAGSKTS